MLEKPLAALKDALAAAVADVAAHGGPSIPPSNKPRRDYQGRFKAAGKALEALEMALSGVPDPDYSALPKKKKAKE